MITNTVKDAKLGRDYHEEVTSQNGMGVIADEAQPPLTRIRPQQPSSGSAAEDLWATEVWRSAGLPESEQAELSLPSASPSHHMLLAPFLSALRPLLRPFNAPG